MKIGYEVFLAVCEELSITKAAKRLYITQQATSDHIRRLEEQFHVTLFKRKPEFELTEAGQTLRNSLQNIKIMENNMSRNLNLYAKGLKGTFRVGISTSRAPIILPLVLPQFSKEYPLVHISFDEEDTKILEDRLRNGDIDLFIGVNTTPDENFNIHTIASDDIMLVISDKLLRKHFTEEGIQDLQLSVDLKKFSEVPFILPNFKTGKVNHVIQEYLNSKNICLQVKFDISDNDTQLRICTTGECAALCSRMLLGYVKPYNRKSSPSEKLHVFSLKDFNEDLRLEMVIHKQVLYPHYVYRFMELVREKVQEHLLP